MYDEELWTMMITVLVVMMMTTNTAAEDDDACVRIVVLKYVRIHKYTKQEK